MKKLLYPSIFLNAIGIIGLLYILTFTTKGKYLADRITIYPNSINWKIENEKHSLYSKNSPKHGIVFFGHSIIYECHWHELLNRSDAINRGIPGDKLDGMLLRIDSVLKQRPNSIVIMAGINDLLAKETPVSVFTKYKYLLNKVSSVPQVIVCSTLPTAQNLVINKDINTLNIKLKDLCWKNGYTWLDLYSEFTTNGCLIYAFSHDGLHLNAQGYAKWRDLLVPILNKPNNSPI